MINYYFCEQSPTVYNLEQQLKSVGAQFNRQSAQFSDCNLSLDERKTIYLEYKHLLAQLLHTYQLEVMPASFAIDCNNYAMVLTSLPPESWWILKPAMMNNAEGIKLFRNHAQITQHFQSNQCFDGPHVLQRYIQSPHLLNGHKYTFRLFVLITDFAGVYLYPQGYFNVAITPYNRDSTNLSCHLTNEHLNANHQANVHQIPTSHCPNFAVMFNEMKHIITQVCHAFIDKTALEQDNTQAFGLFGFDFIVDDKLKCWLLEVNHGPCFPTHLHVLNQVLYTPFWQDICHNFVVPIAQNIPIAQNTQFIRL